MDRPFLSFAEQALHYFNREHDDVRRDPLVGPAVWRGANVAGRRDWIVELGAIDIAEIERALATARDAPMGTMRREDFPLPTLAPCVAEWRRELASGRGFLVVRGLPVERWGDADAARAYWGIGLHLGRPGAQNPDDELLGHVVDTGGPTLPRARRALHVASGHSVQAIGGATCDRSFSYAAFSCGRPLPQPRR